MGVPIGEQLILSIGFIVLSSFLLKLTKDDEWIVKRLADIAFLLSLLMILVAINNLIGGLLK